MIIRVKTPDKKLFIPVPTVLAGAVAKLIPESAFVNLRGQAPPALRSLITRKNFLTLYRSCAKILAEHKGLEIVHIETKDGKSVSITL